jgi:hypothetical protein
VLLQKVVAKTGAPCIRVPADSESAPLHIMMMHVQYTVRNILIKFAHLNGILPLQ